MSETSGPDAGGASPDAGGGSRPTGGGGAASKHEPGTGKPPNEHWQRCRRCGTWWPVDADFASLEAGVEVECPSCHLTARFAPEAS